MDGEKPRADIDGRARDEAYETEMQEYRRRIETAIEEEDKAQLSQGKFVALRLPSHKKTLVERFVEYMTTDPVDYTEIANKNLDVVQVK